MTCPKQSGARGGSRPSPNRKLNDDQVSEIRHLLNEGRMTKAEIARQFGIRPNTLRGIENGTIYRLIH